MAVIHIFVAALLASQSHHKGLAKYVFVKCAALCVAAPYARERRRSSKRAERSRSRGRHSRRRRSPSSSSDDEMGGYVPRKRQEPPRPGAPVAGMLPHVWFRSVHGLRIHVCV